MGRHRRWSDDELIGAVARSGSYAQVMQRLGLRRGGGTIVQLRKHVERLNLSTAHFHGQAWASGRSFPDRPRLPLGQVLVRGRRTNGRDLRKRLIAEGLKEARCEWCGGAEWLGQPMPLEIDHIDGDHANNVLTNLRILCANCHALTPTYCGRNKGRVVELVDTLGLGPSA